MLLEHQVIYGDASLSPCICLIYRIFHRMAPTELALSIDLIWSKLLSIYTFVYYLYFGYFFRTKTPNLAHAYWPRPSLKKRSHEKRSYPTLICLDFQWDRRKYQNYVIMSSPLFDHSYANSTIFSPQYPLKILEVPTMIIFIYTRMIIIIYIRLYPKTDKPMPTPRDNELYTLHAHDPLAFWWNLKWWSIYIYYIIS